MRGQCRARKEKRRLEGLAKFFICVIAVLSRLAIPAVAILDFVYSTYLLPWVKAKRDKRLETEGENVVQEAEDSPPPEEAE